MAKIKRQSVSEVSRKARTAREFSGQKPKRAGKYGGPQAEYQLQETAMNLSRGKPKGAVGKLKRAFVDAPTRAESKAAMLMQNQRAAELTRSEARAKGVTKRAAAKAQKAKTTRALTGAAKKAKKK